jgi:hypothetical protein
MVAAAVVVMAVPMIMLGSMIVPRLVGAVIVVRVPVIVMIVGVIAMVVGVRHGAYVSPRACGINAAFAPPGLRRGV